MTHPAENDAPADYRCKWCGKVVKRRSAKAWIRSVCGDTGRTVHLTRVIPPDVSGEEIVEIPDKVFGLPTARPPSGSSDPEPRSRPE